MLRLILNVIWLVLCGWWMAILYFLAGLLAFILIITIPFGFACFRIAGFALWPFGRRIVRRPSAGAPSIIGNINFQVGDKRLKAGPGDIVVIPPGVPHKFANDGPGRSRIVCIHASPTISGEWLE